MLGAALPRQKLPRFMIESATSPATAARALEFPIRTATRESETTWATGRQVDLDHANRAIPPERMKAGRVHRVPPSQAALAIVKAMQPLRGGSTMMCSLGSEPRHRLRLSRS